MMSRIWLVGFLLGSSLAMKRSLESVNEEPGAKQLEMSEEASSGEDLMAKLPLELIYEHLALDMTASAALTMSMTSKTNSEIFKKSFELLLESNPEAITEDLFAQVNEDGTKAMSYPMIKKALTKTLISYKDCLLRFRRADLNYAILAKANNLPRRLRYPAFFDMEEDVPYVHVPGPKTLGWSAIIHRAFKKYLFTADLFLDVPVNIIKTLVGDDDIIIEASIGELERLIEHDDLLKEIAEAGLLEYFEDGKQPLFKRLVEVGLDDILMEDLQQDEEPKLTTLALALYQVTPENAPKLEKIVDQINPENMRAYSYLLCKSDLVPDTIMDMLYKDPLLDNLLAFALLLDDGKEVEETLFTEFFVADQINSLLDSYSEELEDFTEQIEADPQGALFIAICREKSDKLIMALIRKMRFEDPVGVFFFLLLSGRSEDLVRYFLTTQHETWIFEYSKNMPSNVTIPNSLLCDILPHLESVVELTELIQSPEKYVDAIEYIAEQNLWTDSISLLAVVQNAIKFPRPYVLQAVLDLATNEDLSSFALQPIFLFEGQSFVEATMQRYSVMEYLSVIAKADLVRVIELAGPQSPEIFNTSSEDPINCSMLPLIFRLVLMDPVSFIKFMKPENRRVVGTLIHEALTHLFPGETCPTTDSKLFPRSFFMLIREMVRENLKADSIIYPVSTLAISNSFATETDLNFPEDFTFLEKTRAKSILKCTCAAMPFILLESFLIHHKDKTRSPFTEAVFRELMRRPKFILRLIKNNIMEVDELVHLLRTFLPLANVTDEMLNSIRDGTLSQATCPWLNTGLQFSQYKPQK